MNNKAVEQARRSYRRRLKIAAAFWLCIAGGAVAAVVWGVIWFASKGLVNTAADWLQAVA